MKKKRERDREERKEGEKRQEAGTMEGRKRKGKRES